GLQPSLDPFRVASGDRDLDAPIQVPRDRSVLQAFPKPAAREGEHVMPPVLLVVRGPFRQGFLEGAEADEEMFRLLRNRRGPVDLALRILQLEGIEDPAAVLALIAPGPGEAAVRTCPLHVAVTEKPQACRSEGSDHLRYDHM